MLAIDRRILRILQTFFVSCDTGLDRRIPDCQDPPDMFAVTVEILWTIFYLCCDIGLDRRKDPGLSGFFGHLLCLWTGHVCCDIGLSSCLVLYHSKPPEDHNSPIVLSSPVT